MWYWFNNCPFFNQKILVPIVSPSIGILNPENGDIRRFIGECFPTTKSETLNKIWWEIVIDANSRAKVNEDIILNNVSLVFIRSKLRLKNTQLF